VARGVALARPLDLDDVGAKVAQQHAAIRTGQMAAEVEDAQTFKSDSHESNPIRKERAGFGDLSGIGVPPVSRCRRI
jgi:hypothetical protein